ncbi:MAG TPA: nitrate- and nitrite sensing domain-containing protein [Streptosporangiaceae bacterium]
MVKPRQRGRADQGMTRSAEAMLATDRLGQVQPGTVKRTRTRSIRTTLVGLLLVPLVALVSLWVFLASITLGNALAERNFNRLGAATSKSTQSLLTALEQERSATFLWLSSQRRSPVSQLAASRRADDAAIASYEKSNAEGLVAKRALVAQLRKIPRLRSAIDAGTLSASGAFQAYSGIVDGLFAVYTSKGQSDISLYRHTLGAIDAGRALEQLSRELTLVAGAEISHGQMNATDGRLFADAVAGQHLLVNDAITQADQQLRTRLQSLYDSPLHLRLAALEDQIAGSTRGRPLPPSTLKAWGSVSMAFLLQFLAVSNGDAGPLAAEAGRVGSTLFREAGLAGGLGLLAVLAAVFLMVRFGRSIRTELTGLHDGADVLANQRLPHVIERLRTGDEVDVAAESPPLATGKITEIVRVAGAFSSLQRIAVDAAVGQANLRRGVSRVFLNMSLRNQSLLHRQLRMLDAMERATNDPAVLADLFRLDHLTTRMRRNAESLIILSGATPGRGWREPVPVFNILRAAVAEVEDYVRVDVLREPSDSIAGPAVNDVVHLIAELVENATVFSPPNTRVEVRADSVGHGIAVEIEDRGLGLTPAELDEINARLASPPGFDLATNDQLGLFVVGQLASRHGIKVSLRESAYGGTRAVVLLPHSVIVRQGETSAQLIPADAGQQDTVSPDAVLLPASAPGLMANRELTSTLSVSGQYRIDAVPLGSRTEPWAEGTRGLWEPIRRQAPPGQYTSWDTPSPALTQDPATAPHAAVSPAPHSGSAGAHRGLPRRVRQTSLAPQLRKAGPPGENTSGRGTAAQDAAPGHDRRAATPEDTLSRMSALQDGWQRGRVDDLGWPSDKPADAPDAPEANDGEAW